jgi:hypothetical protein
MSTPRPAPTTHLLVRNDCGPPYWEVKFRDDGRQVKRRVGPAWVARPGSHQAQPNGKTYGDGAWIQRRGRPLGNALSYDEAITMVPGLVNAYRRDRAEVVNAAEAARVQAVRPRTFRELAQAWREWLDHKGTRPSTLVGYDVMLAEPGSAFRRGEGTKVGYILPR